MPPPARRPYHLAVPHGTRLPRRQVYAQSLCRAVIKQGRETFEPRAALEANGLDLETIEALGSASNMRAQREAFAALDDALREVQ